MGIKDYLKNITKNYSIAYSSNIINYDYLYIDCNYLLHYLIYKCTNEDELYNKINNYFHYLFNIIKINNEIYLFFDGMFDNNLENDPKLLTNKNRKKNKKESLDFDKQDICPKSNIINIFKIFLEDILNKFKKINKHKFNILFNDDYNEGEGDIKILNLLDTSNHNNICILTKDSDMILISCSIIINKNINIYILTSIKPTTIINVNNILSSHNKIQKDYILIMLLLGNDYLPKVSNTSYDILIECYKKYIDNENDYIITETFSYYNFIKYITYIIINNNIKFNISKLNNSRMIIYYNNLLWCLKLYKIIENNFTYINDNTMNTINIYNIIYSTIKL